MDWPPCKLGLNPLLGSISGQVTDQQSAAIVGAEIKLVDPSTNTARTTTNNDVGRYSFASVAPGTYDVS